MINVFFTLEKLERSHLLRFHLFVFVSYTAIQRDFQNIIIVRWQHL